MKVIFAALFFGWLVSFSAFGQENEAKLPDPFAAASKDSAPKNISVQLELIEISHKDLTRLLMEHKPKSADATALRMKVQEMVDKNVAKTIDTQMVVSKVGLKTSSASKQETIYPTDYQFAENKEKADKEFKSSDGIPVCFGNPTAFEIRNVGTSIESEINCLVYFRVCKLSKYKGFIGKLTQNLPHQLNPILVILSPTHTLREIYTLSK
jgi:hypothetical protein